MLIKVKYFAVFREKAGVAEEELQGDFATYAELYQWLADKYQFALPAEMVQVAVDDEFSSMQTSIAANSKVVFIPPVAGG